jgi:transcription-repair coupling factor (superfamily II helicase)
VKDGIFSLDKGNLYEIKKSVDARKNPIVFYAAPNNRCHLASAIGRPFVYVAGDWVDARKIFERISEYGEGNYALMPEREDVLIKRKVCNYAALRERLDILKKMADGKLDGLVITCESLLQFYPEKKPFFEQLYQYRKRQRNKNLRFCRQTCFRSDINASKKS